MNRTQAETLAEKLSTSFARTQIDPKAWADQLVNLDHQAADEVVSYFVRYQDKQPTIAQFLSQYHRARESDVSMSQFRPDPKAISFNEYYGRIMGRAAKGDRECIEMVEIWDAILEKQS